VKKNPTVDTSSHFGTILLETTYTGYLLYLVQCERITYKLCVIIIIILLYKV